MGKLVIEESVTLTVGNELPADTALRVCIQAGGGSGARSQASAAGSFTSGGRRGDGISFNKNYVLSTSVAVVIGEGGAAQLSGHLPGLPGGDTTFDDQGAIGGVGGLLTLGYAGLGAPYTSTCDGSVHFDGSTVDAQNARGAGGEASNFGDATSGTIGDGVGVRPGNGAGGGSAADIEIGAPSPGGKGLVVVTWDDPVVPAPETLRVNGEIIAVGSNVYFECKDTVGLDYSGPVDSVILNDIKVWEKA